LKAAADRRLLAVLPAPKGECTVAIFPKIQSPCPYKGDLSAIMVGDMCRLCKRQVVDITNFSDAERVSLIEGCAEEICVSYSLPMRIAAAAALAALSMPTAAAAQDAPVDLAPPEVYEDVFIGGITDPSNTEFVSLDEDQSVPELPVTYEDGASRETAQPVAKAEVAPPGLSSDPGL
jgi:hypothetical protein